MIVTLLQNYADRFIGFLNRFSQSRFWIFKSALLFAIISVFFAFPPYNHVINNSIKFKNATDWGGYHDIYTMVGKQIENPMMVVPAMEGRQMEKRQFRLTMPVIGHILHTTPLGLIILQHVFGIFLFAVCIALGARITNDRVLGLLIGLGFAFVYTGEACFVDLFPWFDGSAYLFLALAMWSRKPIFIFLFVLLAAYTDERALMASAFVFTWWKMQETGNAGLNLKRILLPAKFTMAVLLAWGVYFTGRSILSDHFGFLTHSGHMHGKDAAYTWTYQQFWFGILSSIKWFWVVIIAGFLLLFKQKKPGLVLFTLVPLMISLTAALLVHDVTKSAGYVFPLVFIFLFLFHQQGETVRNLRYFMLIIVVLCFLMPSFNIYGGVPYLTKPVFIEWFND